MKINELKKKACRNLERTVRESVGKSTPIIFHEPKVPECLKKNK